VILHMVLVIGLTINLEYPTVCVKIIKMLDLLNYFFLYVYILLQAGKIYIGWWDTRNLHQRLVERTVLLYLMRNTDV